jgi:hypothetical protein
MGLCIDLGYAVESDTLTVDPPNGVNGDKVTITVPAAAGTTPISGGLKFIKTTAQNADYQQLHASYPSGSDWVFIVRRGSGDVYDVTYYVTCIAVS